ncbi:hypothetical protein [Zhihengliuella flava]|uniref:Uncharacterized protein n=1 Tax=Zhihengliuella flava TaxID=1285193 RepID=A0A931DFC8_9MICC|nr:hypothetical protein [Zhihengliuella flava]MBG6085830.1 hypothetical protein [Zhihengliuella flava]
MTALDVVLWTVNFVAYTFAGRYLYEVLERRDKARRAWVIQCPGCTFKATLEDPSPAGVNVARGFVAAHQSSSGHTGEQIEHLPKEAA